MFIALPPFYCFRQVRRERSGVIVSAIMKSVFVGQWTTRDVVVCGTPEHFWMKEE
jgi:hypothetical protein